MLATGLEEAKFLRERQKESCDVIETAQVIAPTLDIGSSVTKHSHILHGACVQYRM